MNLGKNPPKSISPRDHRLIAISQTFIADYDGSGLGEGFTVGTLPLSGRWVGFIVGTLPRFVPLDTKLVWVLPEPAGSIDLAAKEMA